MSHHARLPFNQEIYSPFLGKTNEASAILSYVYSFSINIDNSLHTLLHIRSTGGVHIYHPHTNVGAARTLDFHVEIGADSSSSRGSSAH